MAIRFRGGFKMEANSLNHIMQTQNQHGFQDKSAAGHQAGVGGEETSLAQAKASFEARKSDTMKPCVPITSKSRGSYVTSPTKINADLIAGEAGVHKEFMDAAEVVGKSFEKYKPKEQAAPAPKEKTAGGGQSSSSTSGQGSGGAKTEDIAKIAKLALL